MANYVKSDGRAERSRATERRIVTAAYRLFVERGWAGTTLADVAEAAGVSERTVYVRFGTKARVLHRVIEVAVVGDDEQLPVRDREWYRRAVTAPSLEERIDAYAAGASALMERAAPVIAVAGQAVHEDEEIAALADQGHRGTRDDIRRIWRTAAADGLLSADIDARWLADTVAVLGQADVYLLGQRVLGWTPRTYERWLRHTVCTLAGIGSAVRG